MHQMLNAIMPLLPASSTGKPVRRKRMELILQKALDVSVHDASLVDLRSFLESECGGDEELLAAFFSPSSPESPEHDSVEEVAAQAVLSLRQKVETLFGWLCETHDVDTELLELEDVINQAEERRLRRVDEKDAIVQETSEGEKDEQNQTQEETSPEAQIRAERLRAKQEEKKELENLVATLEAKNKDLQKAVEEKRRVAIADVQRMQRAAMQLEEASEFAQNYASSM
ncbi:Nnf1 [Plasmopara halstedii]|uniref:Nnf1 n=1 Tax=Plasmopara halstedii TaxID=4781 RepID=A0A0P1AHF2_PLAHL|nr:Nnf1 [Plasmopara halstedii]CEG40678.1 Nnf1 [Plasmopara halstedii]|eukprot:XP_024577047.1 Nnf1 [Plasmopara halstedii]